MMYKISFDMLDFLLQHVYLILLWTCSKSELMLVSSGFGFFVDEQGNMVKKPQVLLLLLFYDQMTIFAYYSCFKSFHLKTSMHETVEDSI